MGLMGKSKAFALNIVWNHLWQKVGQHFLTSTLKDYYVSYPPVSQPHRCTLKYSYLAFLSNPSVVLIFIFPQVGSDEQHSVSDPQLNNTVVFSVNGGAKARKVSIIPVPSSLFTSGTPTHGRAEVLHRDDVVHHTWPPAAASHTLGRDNGIGFFVAGKRSTVSNGATRFIPGSHLWDYSIPPPAEPSPLICQPELEPGDSLMMFSGCYHGASANTTQDEERLIYSTFSTRGYLRQEENQYLACDREKVLELPVELQRFMGYTLSRPFMGWVEMDDPIKVIDPNAKSLGDLW